jgi:membrane protein DedA with SNARE-associated domain
MEHLLHVVLKHGYVLIFIVVLLDQAAVSIPSPPFVTGMGVLASSGRFNIYVAFAVVFTAAFIADWLWFRIGASVGRSLYERRRSRHWNEKSSRIACFTGRGMFGAVLGVKFSLLPSLLVPLASGSTGSPTRRFLYNAACGNLAWTGAYLLGGFIAGYSVMNTMSHTSVVVIASLSSFLIPVILSVFHWRPSTANPTSH